MSEEEDTEGAPWLTGQLLIAMPSMQDPRFEKTVILICSHAPDGAMGIILNRLLGDLSFRGLLNQLKVDVGPQTPEMPIYFGGPVDPVRGFVIHSTDYRRAGTTFVSPSLALTATVEILQSLSQGRGPRQALLALGYAGWAPGQLESEIQANGWLTAPAPEDLVFDGDVENKWNRSLSLLGVSPSLLVGDIGHA